MPAALQNCHTGYNIKENFPGKNARTSNKIFLNEITRIHEIKGLLRNCSPLKVTTIKYFILDK